MFGNRNSGLSIGTRHDTKPNWFEVVEYDRNGEQCGVSYENA